MDGDDGQPRVARAGRRARAEQASMQQEGGSYGYDGGMMGEEPPQARGAFGDQSPRVQSPEPQPRQAPPVPRQEEEAGPPVPRRGGFADGLEDGGPGPAAARMPAGPADPLADDGGKRFDGVSKRKHLQQQREEEEQSRQRTGKYEERAVESVLEIPELEEEGKEDLSRVVAAAPKVRINRVQAMTELDDDMQYRLPNMDDRDIDLSLLTTVLCSAEQVVEGDDLWDPDMLFTAVASELNSEKEKAEGPTAEAPDEKQQEPAL